MELKDLFAYLALAIKNSLGVLFDPGHFLSLGPLLVAFFIAAIVFELRLRQRGSGRNTSPRRLWSRLFPKRIFLHPSAKTDYAIFVINEGVLFILTVSMVLTPAVVAHAALVAVGGHVPAADVTDTGLLSKLGATVFLVLVWDFSATYAHYLKHKVPILWEFHKVHHCAEVLTPVTALRRHPIDKLFSGLTTTVSLGFGVCLWVLLTGQPVETITVFGGLAGVYLWRLLGYNLRHSHVCISYGKLWERIFISPAQHQVHHSIDPKHHHRNFGHIFSFWDAMFGSLYMPEANERMTFGVGPYEMPKNPSLLQLYFRPFAEALHRIVPNLRRLLG